MKQLSDLTREQLEDIVGQVRDVLWQDPVSDELDPLRAWDMETLEWVSRVIEDAGLKPDPVRPDSPATEDNNEEPAAFSMRSALKAFVGTIEATGGCIRPGGVTGGPAGEEAIDFEDDRPVPAGDESWPDLADAYIPASRALGREPVNRDEDDEDDPGAGE